MPGGEAGVSLTGDDGLASGLRESRARVEFCEEASDGFESAVFEDPIQRLPAPSGPRGEYRAYPRRPGDAVRRIPAAFLAAGLLFRRFEGPAAAAKDPRGGSC